MRLLVLRYAMSNVSLQEATMQNIRHFACAGFAVVVLAAIATPAHARIQCQGNFQVSKYGPIATPYCEEEQIARVAQATAGRSPRSRSTKTR